MNTKTRTENVTGFDLKIGDVIVAIDAVEFPFPFVLTRATVLADRKGKRCATQVAASHGWFGIIQANHVVKRVVVA